MTFDTLKKKKKSLNVDLFHARPNSIRTFGLRIKQHLSVSSIDVSDILEHIRILVYEIQQKVVWSGASEVYHWCIYYR